MTNKILANSVAAPATATSPSVPAMIAAIRNISVYLNIKASLRFTFQCKYSMALC